MKSKATSKKQPVFSIVNTNPGDWKDPQQVMELFPVTIGTLRNYRRRKVVPSAKLGGKIFFYLPGILRKLEESASG